MSMMAGAFGSFPNFLNCVVFENCIEYFQARDAEKPDLMRRVQSRAFFNAIVALDSAADYLSYAEPHTEANVSELLNNLGEPALKEIREIANALKHCVRHKPELLHAAAIAKPNIGFQLDTSSMEVVRVELQFSMEYFEEADRSIKAAFDFWMRKSDAIARTT